MTVSTKNAQAVKKYNELHQRDFRKQTLFHWPVANAIGMAEAILLEIIHDWSESNCRLCKTEYFHDDEWWTKGSYEKWANNYPALGSTRSIQRKFLDLEQKGYVMSFREKGGEKFYRVNKQMVGLLLISDNLMPDLDHVHTIENTTCQNQITDVPKMDEGRAKNGCPSIYINNINNKQYKEETLKHIEEKQASKIETDNKEKTNGNPQENPVESDSLQIQVVDKQHPLVAMESRFQCNIDETEVRKQLTRVYNEEIPRINNCFTQINAISHRDWASIKRDYLVLPGIDVVELLKNALIFIREDDNEYWRKTQYALANLISNGKLIEYQTKHFAKMQADIRYRKRVNGEERSKDPSRYANFNPQDGAAAQGAAILADFYAKTGRKPNIPLQRTEPINKENGETWKTVEI